MWIQIPNNCKCADALRLRNADREIICGGCGVNLGKPRMYELPARVFETVCRLVQHHMFSLEKIEPSYLHCTPGGNIPMSRVLLKSRAVRGGACTVMWYERDVVALQQSGTWDQTTRQLQLPVPAAIDAAARALNKTYRMNWSQLRTARKAVRMQEQFVRAGETRGIWVGIELAWEDRPMLDAQVVLHALAHEWFGDLCSVEWWKDLSINEACADAVARIYSLRAAGDSVTDDVIAESRAALVTAGMPEADADRLLQRLRGDC